MTAGILLLLDSSTPWCVAVGLLFECWRQKYILKDWDRIWALLRDYHPLYIFGAFSLIIRFYPVNSLIEPAFGFFIISVFFILNYNKIGINIFCVGSLLNSAARIANGGKMPFLSGDGEDATHVLMSADSHLKFLSDIIVAGNYQMSIGDVLIDIGMIIFAISQIYLFFKLKPIKKSSA